MDQNCPNEGTLLPIGLNLVEARLASRTGAWPGLSLRSCQYAPETAI